MMSTVADMIVRWLTVPLALIALAASESSAANYLLWKIELRSAHSPVNGLSFDIYGAQRQLDFVLTFVNEESDRPLVLPANFVQTLRLRVLNQSGRNEPVETRWSAGRLVTSSGDHAITVGEATTLWPDDRVEIQGSLAKPDELEFTPGVYSVVIDVRSAARGIRTNAGTAWSGRYEAEGTVRVQVIEPRTAAERRTQAIIEAHRALEDERLEDALTRFSALVQANPSDLEARGGAGRVYLELGRFKEAVAEFEAVLPSVAGHRSMLYVWLAHAYVGIGNMARAESLLRQQLPPEAVAQRMQALRDDVNRPGRRR